MTAAAHDAAAAARILILSDLHLEFASFNPPEPSSYDVVVLAGDISVGVKAVHWAQRETTFAGKPCVFVAGNHEFYGSERRRMLEQLREAADGSNVSFLDRDEVSLGGVRFLGTTLWTDFELDVGGGLSVERAMRDAVQGNEVSNDFRLIRERQAASTVRKRFTPQDAAAEHWLSRAWLEQKLGEPVDPSSTPTVVVTHHAPSRRSMHPAFKGHKLSPCYASDLPASLFETPALWVHGHLHDSRDYMHHGCRVVCNPRGYVSRSRPYLRNEAFDPGLVIALAPGAEH